MTKAIIFSLLAAFNVFFEPVQGETIVCPESDLDTYLSTIESPEQFRILDCNHKNYQGVFPSSLSRFTQLTHISLAHSCLVGTAGDGLEKLTSLKNLTLYDGCITGISPILKQLTALEHIDLSGNKISATLEFLDTLENKPVFANLTNLYLSRNFFRGRIPASIGLHTNLEELELFGNAITGTVPTEFGHLTKLKYLDLFNLNLIGSIPSELSRLSNLELLWLQSANLGGNLKFLGSENIVNFPKMKYLFLEQLPLLTGSIPKSLSQMIDLVELSIYANKVGGTIPTGIGRLVGLEYLSLSFIDINGTVPSEIGSLSNLEALFLDRTKLSGTFPTEISQLSLLEYLFVSSSQLVGKMPKHFASNTDAQPGVDLAVLNGITGKYPPKSPDKAPKLVFIVILSLSLLFIVMVSCYAINRFQLSRYKKELEIIALDRVVEDAIRPDLSVQPDSALGFNSLGPKLIFNESTQRISVLEKPWTWFKSFRTANTIADFTTEDRTSKEIDFLKKSGNYDADIRGLNNRNRMGVPDLESVEF